LFLYISHDLFKIVLGNADSQWIQCTTHFIEFFVLETKHFVGSFVNVILTRQTCGQRSSRAAESKRRALGNYFPERICYIIQISKFRGDRHLGLCTTSGLAFGEPMRMATSEEKKCFDAGKIGFFAHTSLFIFRWATLRKTAGMWSEASLAS